MVQTGDEGALRAGQRLEHLHSVHCGVVHNSGGAVVRGALPGRIRHTHHRDDGDAGGERVHLGGALIPVLPSCESDQFLGYFESMAEVGVGTSVEDLLSTMLDA